MACAASTEPPAGATDVGAPGHPTGVTLDSRWRLHPRVAIRPERFGALLYHFDHRTLSFLKSTTLLRVLESLDGGSVEIHEALAAAGVPASETATYLRSLGTLADSSMIEDAS